MGSAPRDHFDEDDDDVYTTVESDQPVNVNTGNGVVGNVAKPPQIPTRIKKATNLASSPVSVDNEYIVMPPSRLREMVDGQNNVVSSSPPAGPAPIPVPIIPPKPSATRTSSSGTNSPPPPLLPR